MQYPIPTPDFFVGVSVILTALSLIVTVVGWTITYRRQKEILERQISATLEKEKVTLSLGMALGNLEKVRSWIHRGFAIASLVEKVKGDVDAAELREMYEKWNLDGDEMLRICFYLDQHSRTTRMRNEHDYLEQSALDFANGVRSEYKQRVLKEKLNEWESDYDTDLDLGFEALDKIDILTQEALGQSIPNYESRYR